MITICVIMIIIVTVTVVIHRLLLQFLSWIFRVIVVIQWGLKFLSS